MTTSTDLRPQIDATHALMSEIAANANMDVALLYLFAVFGIFLLVFCLVMAVRSIPKPKPKQPKQPPPKREIKAQPWNTRPVRGGYQPQPTNAPPPPVPSGGSGVVTPTFSNQNGFLIAVQNASKTRAWATTWRAIMKLFEEVGEMSEAYLGSTSQTGNYKNKTPADVREEAVDTAILALHIALTPLPGEENLSDAEILRRVMEVQSVKLKKRAAQVAAQGDN